MKNIKTRVLFNGANIELDGSPEDVATVIRQVVEGPKTVSQVVKTEAGSKRKVGRPLGSTNVCRKTDSYRGGGGRPWSRKDARDIINLVKERGPSTRGLGDAAIKMLTKNGSVRRTPVGVHVFTMRLHSYFYRGKTSGLSKSALKTFRENNIHPLIGATSTPAPMEA